jgi:hypothetical protein
VHRVQKRAFEKLLTDRRPGTNSTHPVLKNKPVTTASPKKLKQDILVLPDGSLTYQYVSTHIHKVIHNKDWPLTTVSR